MRDPDSFTLEYSYSPFDWAPFVTWEMYLLAVLRSLTVLATLAFDGHCASIPSATSALGQSPSITNIALLEPSPPGSFRAAEEFASVIVIAAPSPPPLKQNSNSGRNDFGVKINIGIIVSVAAIFLMILALVVWKRWKEGRDLATRISFQEQLRGLQGRPADRTRAQPIYEIDGNTQPAELSGVRDPSELHGTGIRAELPGDHQFPEKTEEKKTC